MFQEWKQGYERFSPDGVPYEAAYKESALRFMFIMKETNSKKKAAPVDLKAFLRFGARSGGDKNGAPRKQTWDGITRWVHGIRNLSEEFKWSELKDHANNREKLNAWRDLYLPAICVINVKKASGIHTAISTELAAVSAKDATFIKRQFDIYYGQPETRPHIIIACGTDAFINFNKHVRIVASRDEWHETTRGVSYAITEHNTVVIWYAHPEARVDDSLLYYGLIDAVREIQSVHKLKF